MLIPQSALFCLNGMFHSLGRSIAPEAEAPRLNNEVAPVLRADSYTPIPIIKVNDKPPSPQEERPIPVDPPQAAAQLEGPLTVRERRARAAALRGLALSRSRRFGGARDAFIEASRLDPLLDLTRIPMFWSLERSAHEAVIEAYLETGRQDEATVLRAQVLVTYRPRALSRQISASLVTSATSV